MARHPLRPEGDEVPAGFNPYVEWAWGPGRPYYFLPGLQPEGKERMPVLLQLQGITAKDFVEGRSFIDDEGDRREWRESFHALFARITPDARAKDVSWVVGMVTQDISDIIASEKVSPFVQNTVLGRPLDARSLPLPDKERTWREPLAGQAESGGTPISGLAPTPRTVVMGIIDDGIAFANERFRRQDGTTRVEHWWLMDAPQPGGKVLDKASIDTLLANHTNGSGILDEEGFYREAELIDFRQPNHKSAAQTAAHGTHVMDLAAGFDPADNRDDRPIVCVQLPTRVTAAVDNGNLLPFVALAIEFIILSALQISADRHVAPLPVVINFSYGRYEGPHDGTHPVEQVIRAAIRACRLIGFPLRVVLPAGNSFLERTHAELSFNKTAAETQTVPWRVLPDDRTDSFVEVWLPNATVGPGRFSVSLTTPTQQTFLIDESQVVVPFPYGWLACMKLPTRTVFFIILLPTTAFQAGATLAPAGTYEIAITRGSGPATSDIVHAWVARDETLPGYPQAGRQSFFDDPAYQRFDYAGRDLETDDTSMSVVKRRGTINSIATDDSLADASPIVTGGHLPKELKAAKYSSAATRSPPPREPDATAPSDDSRVHAGVLAAGTRSNSVFAMAGTSVAAPQVARLVADNLAVSGLGDRAMVRIRAAADEGSYGLGAPAPPPPERGGAGRIRTVPIVKLPRYEGM